MHDQEGDLKLNTPQGSAQQTQKLEDMVTQHEGEVRKLESMIGQQNARQTNRLEERLKLRKEAQLRQLKLAKVDKKHIKKRTH